jgi:hypothetical protein
MYCTDNDRNEFIKASRERYDVASPYGEMIQQKESRFLIDAIEDSEILEVNYQDILEFSKGHICWERALYMLKIHFLFKEQREYDLLILDAKERYLIFAKEFPTFLKRVPKFQIASYLGIKLSLYHVFSLQLISKSEKNFHHNKIIDSSKECNTKRPLISNDLSSSCHTRP